MKTIVITMPDDRSFDCPTGTAVGSLFEGQTGPGGLPYIAALVNNDVASLSYPLTVNAVIKPLTAADSHGWRVYRRSLCFLLAKTMWELFPEHHFSLEHSFGAGLYWSFGENGHGTPGITDEQLRTVEGAMRSAIEVDLPIERRKIAYTEAVLEFERTQQVHKLNLLKHRNPPRVVLHWCKGYSDLAHGPLVPSMGALNVFALIPYAPGFVLQLPDRDNLHQVAPFESQPHLFQIFREHKQWGRILGLNTVGRLNETIHSGAIAPFIMTAEALHEKKCARIADQIAENSSSIKVILIAGPSSAGKTTFAKRLTNHLRVNGLHPLTLGTDDYFVGPAQTPRDENGDLDFEHIDAVDVPLFNHDLLKLVQGEKIDVPHFNFEKKEREYAGRRLRVADDEILIIEGIHGLNPRLTEMIPPEHKFKIYISALTQLSLDLNNRISTTDNRLMRRMVRDSKFRGHAALETLSRWPSVRRGENRWIFPFQNEADVTFNSALDYELAILKPLVEPLLMQIKPHHEEYAESRRLTEFLLNFLAAPAHLVPADSILREYIGGSTFEY